MRRAASDQGHVSSGVVQEFRAGAAGLFMVTTSDGYGHVPLPYRGVCVSLLFGLDWHVQ
jgi:hypothetical protein